MRHHNRNKKLSRETGERTALLRSLARSLILQERITTTETRAKALRPLIERLVSRNKVKSLAARRSAVSTLGNSKDAAKKLANVLGPRYAARGGGYLRIVKLGQRKGDAGLMVRIEFV